MTEGATPEDPGVLLRPKWLKLIESVVASPNCQAKAHLSM